MNPKTKIFFNGKQIRRSYVRTKKGTFTKRSSFWLVAVALAAYGIPSLILMPASTVEYVNAEPLKAIDHTPEKISALKAETVSMISQCEVPNYKEGDAPIILDTNSKMSVGPLMFQIATVIQYEKSLYGKEVSRLEATQIALDASQAKQLATDILFKAGGANNWYTCSRKNDIAGRIKLIKELEQ